MRPDRQIHGITEDGGVIVRYDRAGAWYYEEPGQQRTRIRVAEAVALACVPGAHWFEGKPGGLYFDAQVRKIRGSA
jgi:hypothetical protein